MMSGRRVDAGLLDDRLEHAREVVQERQVRLDLLTDPGALYLHDDRLARVSHRAVHLRDRRARERDLVERREQLLDGATQASLDLAEDLGDGQRRAVVLQRLELFDPVGGEQVRPGREELPELRERRPELGEELAEPRGGLAIRRRQRRAVGRRGVAAEHVAEPRLLEVRAEAVPRDRVGDLAEPVQILEGALEHATGRTVAPRSGPRHAAKTAHDPGPAAGVLARRACGALPGAAVRGSQRRSASALLAAGARLGSGLVRLAAARSPVRPRGRPGVIEPHGPMPEIAQPTPMMRQYLETKARYPDALLFFRLGDFYEMFFEDALTASEALQITLTARAKGDDKVPMCGVPHHAARGYVAKLLEKGFKVAICDQVEEPGKSAIVRREVTRVVTPGMVLDDQVLDPREASYLGVVALGDGRAGLALLDASTGQLQCGEVGDDARLVDELRRAGVRELVLPLGADDGRVEHVQKAVGVPAARRPAADFERAEEKLRRHLGVPSLDGFGVAGRAARARRRGRPRSRTSRTPSALRRATWTGSRGCARTTCSSSTRRPGRTSSSSGRSRAAARRGRSSRSSTGA